LVGDLPPLQYPPFSITETHQKLAGADLVVADLSKERPSCYFELGIAEALHKNIIRIAEQDTTIHQTSDKDKIIYYNNLEDYEIKMRSILEKHASITG
jgi:nucleoside 2-deoxyribosyltransferase